MWGALGHLPVSQRVTVGGSWSSSGDIPVFPPELGSLLAGRGCHWSLCSQEAPGGSQCLVLGNTNYSSPTAWL